MSDIAAATPLFSKPQRALPAGACDSHAHVIGPFDQFPLGEVRSYTPPPATETDYSAMLSALGFERGVIVQPTAYGSDTRCIEHAVAQAPDRRRAIGVAGPDVADAELARMAAAGVAGLRFVEIISQRYGGRPKGSIGFAELAQLAPRMAEHGLHAETFSNSATFAEGAEALLDGGVPLVLGHMASAGQTEASVQEAGFQRILGLLREGRIWVKLTVIRRSKMAPGYEDARPFHDALIEANPGRLVWGTDWPLVNMGEAAPDIGKLLDLFDAWIGGDDDLKRRILVDNPAALYGFGR